MLHPFEDGMWWTVREPRSLYGDSWFLIWSIFILLDRIRWRGLFHSLLLPPLYFRIRWRGLFHSLLWPPLYISTSGFVHFDLAIVPFSYKYACNFRWRSSYTRHLFALLKPTCALLRSLFLSLKSKTYIILFNPHYGLPRISRRHRYFRSERNSATYILEPHPVSNRKPWD